MSRRKILVGAIAGSMLILAAGLLLLLPATVTSIPAPAPRGTFGQILPNRPVTWELACPRDGLAGIDLLLGTYARRNPGRLELTIRPLGAGGGSAPVRTVTAAMAELRDNRFHRFRFPPIRGSAGRRFRLVLSAPDAAPGRSVTVYRSARNPAAPCFRGVTREPLGRLTSELLGQASLWKPFPFGRPAVLIILSALFSLAAAVLAVLAFRAVREA